MQFNAGNNRYGISSGQCVDGGLGVIRATSLYLGWGEYLASVLGAFHHVAGEGPSREAREGPDVRPLAFVVALVLFRKDPYNQE